MHTDSTTVNNDLDPNEVTLVEYVLKFEMNFTLIKNRSLEKTVRVYKPVMIEVLKQMTLQAFATFQKHTNMRIFLPSLRRAGAFLSREVHPAIST